MAPALSLYSVKAVVILADDGSRIFAKYYTPPHTAPAHHGGHNSSAATAATPDPLHDVKGQKAFEKGLLDKTAKQTADILLYDNHIVLYKTESDVTIYVVGSLDENEVLLYNVVLTIRDAMHLLLKQSIDKRTLIECYDILALAMDEIVDDGVILETDPSIVVTRVSRAPAKDTVDLRGIDPFSEQGVNNLAQLGKAKLTDWLRQGL